MPPSGSDDRVALAFVLALVGGLLLLEAVAILLLFNWRIFTFQPPILGGLGVVLGTLAGIIILVASLRFRRNPAQGVTWGVLILVFAVFGAATLVGEGASFLLVLVAGTLALTGGALATAVGSAPGGPRGLRACRRCGMVIEAGFAHCPHCGGPAAEDGSGAQDGQESA